MAKPNAYESSNQESPLTPQDGGEAEASIDDRAQDPPRRHRVTGGQPLAPNLGTRLERPKPWERELLRPDSDGHLSVGGYRWDRAKERVAEVLGWREADRTINWEALATWMHGGLDLDDHILPEMRRTVDRLDQPITTLGFFRRHMGMLLDKHGRAA